MQALASNLRYYRRSILLGALTGLMIAAAFAGGFVFRGWVELPPALASSEATRFPLLDEVQLLLDQHYLRPQPDVTRRQYAAIRGLLASLDDRYTFFIEPPVAQSESDVLAGTYGGVGMQVQRSEAGELILYPFPDSPALAAGIREGDILTVINDMPVDTTVQADTLDQMLRGEVKEGNGVQITALKHDTRAEYSVFVPFAVINVPSVLWRVLSENDRIGYIQIQRFTSRTPDELQTAIAELRNNPVAALILDLRNNSGGLLVYEKTNHNEQSLEAAAGGLATDIPLVVLVNQNTASAAELVAGAIRDRDRGILVGQKTFGKGTVQQIFRLSDESSIHITSAEWLTPKRSQLDTVGLEPDIPMIPDPNGRDVELGEAIRYLAQNLSS
jgi:carboxyl-terminal processing protease